MDTIAIKKYLELYNNPQKTYQTIHVGGSNGKGSTSYFLSQMLTQQGLKVGFYFSPYTMTRFDNILIQNEPIRGIQEEFDIFENEMTVHGLTPFEQDTALAFLMFKKYEVDIVVVEVGLGGIHDATNVLDATLALITSTSLEHDEIIGPTLFDIARHQAGIIHHGMKVLLSPNVTGDVKNIFLKRITDVGAKLLNNEPHAFNHDFPLYQQQNLSLAYQALKTVVKNPVIHIQSLKFMPFRFQYMDKHLIFDGAHNLEGIESLIQSLKDKSIQPIVYMSILKTKKFEAMIQRMMEYTKKVYVTSFDHEQSIQKTDVMHLKDVVFLDFQETIHRLKHRNYDTILVTGSLYFLRTVKLSLDIEGDMP